MTDENMKITDRRMFTPEGELREEYRHLEDSRPNEQPPGETPTVDEVQAPGAEESVAESPSSGAARGTATEPLAAPSAEPPSEAPGAEPPSEAGVGVPEPESDRPRGMPPGTTRRVVFEDLVGLLAEHAAIALGDAPLPDGQSMLDLRVAQMHIDLLDVLREKTSGNLTEQEAAQLEELLYRLRLVYVEKSRERG